MSGFKLFRAFGIQVYVHPSWVLVAGYMVAYRQRTYPSLVWNIAEVLTLFGIVLLHEFGHSLACRSVGGRADTIVLWPLGGAAFVAPPPRPGATLWSIVAGPLVNVVLVPITFGIIIANGALSHYANDLPMTAVERWTFEVAIINTSLLVFNLLPIYPLDGGQILRSILWFFMGAGRSLSVASIIGLAGSILGIGFALYIQDWWLILMAGFAAMQSWAAFQRSKLITATVDAPKRMNARCPHCGANPPMGPVWTCQCGQSFDTFETQGRCPRCGGMFMSTMCPACRQSSPPMMWYVQTMPAGMNGIPASYPAPPNATNPPNP